MKTFQKVIFAGFKAQLFSGSKSFTLHFKACFPKTKFNPNNYPHKASK